MLKSVVFVAISLTSFSAFSADINEVGNAIGKAIFGPGYVPGTPVITELAGLDGCVMRVELQGSFENNSTISNFHLTGSTKNKNVIINAFRPSSLKASAERVDFESDGPCLGGFLPGSASCDHNKSSIIVKRNASGAVKSIALKQSVQALFSVPEAIECEY
jgi:hypothetical protein